MNSDDRELSDLIKRHATRHVAPQSLRVGLRAQLALAEASRPPVVRRVPLWDRFWSNAAWRGGSLGFALGLVLTALLLPMVQSLLQSEALDSDLVASHVRAMKVGPLTEVASTDRHTVKPWYQGRLDYSPPVLDLGTEGFALTGGRIEHVRGHVVAALVYMSDRHVIDLYVWPSETKPAQATITRKGFNVVNWSDGAMQYWAVSDVERTKLQRFSELLRQHAAAQ